MYVQITDCTVQPAVRWGSGVEMGPIERNGAEVKRGSLEVCLCQNGKSCLSTFSKFSKF